MPTRLRANCIGSLASKALSNRKQSKFAEVTNTFSNSFYLRTLNGELIFVTNFSARSPITINLDSSLNLECTVRPLDPVHAEQEHIRIGTETWIDLADASSYENSLPTATCAHSLAQIGPALHQASFVLGIIDTTGSVLDPFDPAHGRVTDFVAEGVIPLRSCYDDIRFHEAASKIIGLGSGFSPSCDDMLAGFLAVYNFLSRSIMRAPILLDFSMLEMRTNWISAKLLDCMQHLVLDEQMKRVLLSAIDPEDIILALGTLLPRGHTSGVDICVGVILALSLIRDIALGKEEIEMIALELGLMLQTALLRNPGELTVNNRMP